MKSIRLVLFLLLFGLSLGCSHQGKKTITPAIDTSEVNEVSLLNLIVSPEKYQGHKVRTFGYLNLEFEGDAIYLHKEDYENGLAKNALSLAMTKDGIQDAKIKHLEKNYVLIEGRFYGNDRGLYSGSIDNITQLEICRKITAPAPPGKNDTVKFPPPNPKK